MILFSGALKATQFFGVTGVLTATIAALMFVLMALKKYMWKNFVKANIVLFFVSGIVLYLDNEASGYIDMFLTSRFFIVRKLVLQRFTETTHSFYFYMLDHCCILK
jgi:hypothetical protein